MTIQSAFFDKFNGEYVFDADIGSLTNYGIGGRADILAKPNDIEAMSALMQYCHEENTPLRILGKGQNLLIDDGGIDGVVVTLGATCFSKYSFDYEGQLGQLHAMAGADLARILIDAARLGQAGLEAMAGIPASIGGAIKMNAGGRYGSISDCLTKITCMTHKGENVTYDIADITFNYRKSEIADPLILSGTFELKVDTPNQVREAVKEIFRWKKTKQPLADPSAGCCFKNPIDSSGNRISAGKLIDEAGLKGTKIGGAIVSKSHANFILTSPDATAKNVIELMSLIKQQVFNHSGIQLESEVIIWSRELRQEQ